MVGNDPDKIYRRTKMTENTLIYKLKMGSDTICYIKSDLKNKFSYFKFEKRYCFSKK